MTKPGSHFQLLNFIERKVFIESAWCKLCDEASVVMFNADEFEVYGDTYVKGYCRGCGTKILPEIVEKYIEK